MSQLIVALDFESDIAALQLADKLDPQQCCLKVGNEMFTLYGPELVKQLMSKGFKIFLDLKFHDIPNTVANACKACAELGVWMINVHASGGFKMMQAAQDALISYGKDKPLLIAVTVLTSFNDDDLRGIGINTSSETQALMLAKLAHHVGLDGVVCSAQEVKAIKNHCGSQFLTVTPGIRLSHFAKDDQSRIMTPRQACNEGSDFLVIGRPITQAKDPISVMTEVLKNIS